MDDKPLERLILALSDHVDRRRLGRLAVGALGAASLGLITVQDIDANKKKKKRRKRRRRRRQQHSSPSGGASPGGGSPGGGSSPSSTLWPRRYQGVGELTVQLVNFYGQPIGTPTYQSNVEIHVQEPHSRESNPFGLVVQTKPHSGTSGDFSLYSRLFVDGVLFQFWSYAFDPQKPNDFAGQLTDPHNLNTLGLLPHNGMIIPVEIAPNFTQPYQQSMAKGTEMAGRFAGDQLAIIVRGNTKNLQHPFLFKVLANRTA